jgi:hypothetical protein
MSEGEQFVDYLKEQSASNNDVAVVGVVAREASIPQVTDQFAPPPGQSAHLLLNQGPAPSQMIFFSLQGVYQVYLALLIGIFGIR